MTLKSANFTIFNQSKKPSAANDDRIIFKNYAELGLHDNIDFQKFFISLSEEPTANSTKFSRLDRQAFKEFLQKRYTTVVGEKILLFIETQYVNLYRIDINNFCNIIKDLINDGPDVYKKLIFSCLSQTNNMRMCEHDLF